MYETSWLQLHQSDPGLDSYEDRTLYSTWRISLDRLQQQNDLTVKLLRLWCYFSNQDLWFELLCAGSAKHLPWTQKLTSNIIVFSDAMRLLCNYGLVEPVKVDAYQGDSESGGYSIHSYVHSWSIHVLNDEWDGTLAGFAVEAVAQHVPYLSSGRSWATQRRLLQHAERCSQYLKEGLIVRSGIGRYLILLGHLYRDQARLQDAHAMYQWALRENERSYGPEHVATLSSVQCLGDFYSDQGKLSDAAALYQRVLAGYEKVQEPEHTSTLDVLHHLGQIYLEQNELSNAESMYWRALQGRETVLGPDHLSTLATAGNLSAVSYTHLTLPTKRIV